MDLGKSTILKIISGEENVNSGIVNIRKDSCIGYLKQIYNNVESISVESYLRKSFEEFSKIEKKLKELEEQMIKNPENLDNVLKKYGNLQEKYSSIGGYDLEEKFSKVCSGFKFDKEFLQMNYEKLSGGQKTIVNLAQILLTNPSILLLDEPTNHLDIEMLEWLEKFLIEYKGTILLISHDRYFLDRVATKTILLENGKAKIYFGNYSYFLKEDERRIIAEFEIYKSQQKKIQKMNESIKKLRAFGTIAGNEMFFKRAKSIEKRMEKMEIVEKVDLQKRRLPINLNVTTRSSNDVISINNLSKLYGNKTIFNNFNMEIFYGEKVRLNRKEWFTENLL